MPTISIFWNDATEKRLMELCSQHDGAFSYSWITRRMKDEFNMTFTRNMVLGKAHRMGVRKKGPVLTREEQLARAAKARQGRRVRQRIGYRLRQKIDAPGLVPVLEPAVFSCELVDLTNQTCRWPRGDAKITFCGAPDADMLSGRPYCGFHLRMAYR